MRAICMFLSHKRTGSVWYDGIEFRAACRRCGMPLLKDGLTGLWRPFDRNTDHREDRMPHP